MVKKQTMAAIAGGACAVLVAVLLVPMLINMMTDDYEKTVDGNTSDLMPDLKSFPSGWSLSYTTKDTYQDGIKYSSYQYVGGSYRIEIKIYIHETVKEAWNRFQAVPNVDPARYIEKFGTFENEFAHNMGGGSQYFMQEMNVYVYIDFNLSLDPMDFKDVITDIHNKVLAAAK